MGLQAQALQRTRHAIAANRERLRRRVAVMELECAHVGVEPAGHAPTASLRNEHFLQTTPSFGDGSGVALRATVVAGRANANERSPPVPRALTHDLSRAGIVAARIPGGLCPQPMTSQPVPHGRGAYIASSRYLADGKPFLNERDQHLTGNAAARG